MERSPRLPQLRLMRAQCRNYSLGRVHINIIAREESGGNPVLTALAVNALSGAQAPQAAVKHVVVLNLEEIETLKPSRRAWPSFEEASASN